MHSRKILITGGLGYVGGRVAKYLANDQNLILQLTSSKSDAKKPNWLKTGEVVQWNTFANNELNLLCAEIDTIVHFAAMNEIDSAENPIAALEVNGLGTLRLLEAAQDTNVRRFIYFSTAHVYGSPLVGEISEKTLPRPIHPYAISHKVAEDFVLAAHDKKQIEGIVLRLSNGIGAPISSNVNRWSLIVNDLCRQAVSTHRLTLRTSGLQLRDFVTLHDTARCIEHFIHLPINQCKDGLFNIGGEFVCSIYEITQMVAARCEAILGFKPQISRVEPQGDENALHLEYSIAKLKATGFSLCGNFEDEIDETLKLCQKEFGNY
jgi:UDP-glucose 4-epimerase